MLTRYNSVKEKIKETELAINIKRDEVNSKQVLIENLKLKSQMDKDDFDRKVEQQITELLESELAERRSVVNFDKQILRQFKQNHMDKLDILLARVNSNDNVDDTEYRENFAKLTSLKVTVENELCKHIDMKDLPMYGNTGYGLNLMDTDLEKLLKNVEYLTNLDNYEKLQTHVITLDNKMGSFEVNTLLCLTLFGIVLCFMFKYIIFIPIFIYLIGCLFSRLKHYMYLLKLIDLYNLINKLIEESLNFYEESVSKSLALTVSKLDASRTYMEQMCSDIDREIDEQLAECIKRVRLNFNRDEAREKALKAIEQDDNHMDETIKLEEAEYEELMEELVTLSESLIKFKEDMQKLKDDINNVYAKLEPSFTEKIILKEFFLGFDSNEEPVTFKYGGKSTLILYDGTNATQLDYVMTTVKMMCAQIMCSMFPLAYSIDVVDCYTSGVSLAPFQVKDNISESQGDTDLFKITSTNTKTQNLIKDMYAEFNSRRVTILGGYPDIENLNLRKIEFNARTVPYSVLFLYNFDYSIMKNDEMFRQLCRVSSSVGIIPIVFVDMKAFGKDDKDAGKFFKYKPEIILDALDLFDNNIYGFDISKTGVDIKMFSKNKLQEEYRRMS